MNKRERERERERKGKIPNKKVQKNNLSSYKTVSWEGKYT